MKYYEITYYESVTNKSSIYRFEFKTKSFMEIFVKFDCTIGNLSCELSETLRSLDIFIVFAREDIDPRIRH